MTNDAPQPESTESLPATSKQEENNPTNILKVRDDVKPVFFVNSENSDTKASFTLKEGQSVSWLGDKEEFGHKELRSRIEPWLTALFQSEHLSLLAGSGLMHAVHHIAAG
ncbi:MAG: hypothetical protein RBR82_14170, partial [Pseudomonas sp.]|nr:hypothetical protein [Pseudomonas sp.]